PVRNRGPSLWEAGILSISRISARLFDTASSRFLSAFNSDRIASRCLSSVSKRPEPGDRAVPRFPAPELRLGSRNGSDGDDDQKLDQRKSGADRKLSCDASRC